MARKSLVVKQQKLDKIRKKYLEIQKEKDCLNQVEAEKDLTEEQRNKIEILKGRMKEKEDG